MKTKHLIITLVAVLMSSFAFAQLPSAEMFKKYENSQEVSLLSFTGDMISAMMKGQTGGSSATQSIDFSKIKKVKIITPKDTAKLTDFNELASKVVNSPKYSDLLSVNDSDKKVKIVRLKDAKSINEIVMFVQGDNGGDTAFIALEGFFDDDFVNSISGVLTQFIN